MANESILKYHGNLGQLIFADPTDFDSAAPFNPNTAAHKLIRDAPVPTLVAFDLTGLANGGGVRQSTKTATLDDGGTGERSGWYQLGAILEFATAPADGGTVDFWWAPSASSVAGTGNPGGLTGSDASLTETDGILGQLDIIGTMTLRNNIINIKTNIGIWLPTLDFGMLVIRNNGSTALRSAATAMDETHIVATPLLSAPAA